MQQYASLTQIAARSAAQIRRIARHTGTATRLSQARGHRLSYFQPLIREEAHKNDAPTEYIATCVCKASARFEPDLDNEPTGTAISSACPLAPKPL